MNKFVLILAMLCPFVLTAAGNAAELKIGTISLQKIIQDSKAGQEAQKTIQGKAQELKDKLQGDQDELEGMRAEIEKKNSIWSADIKEEKEREYQKKLRAFQVKSEDAQYEMKQLEAKVMGPILKELHEAIARVGKGSGYTIILENSRKGLQSQIGLMYADDSLDISDMVLKELDKK